MSALLGKQVLATFLIRFHASGKVSVEMRPACSRPVRSVLAEEVPRDRAQSLRSYSTIATSGGRSS